MHRHAEGERADLEAGALARRVRLGPGEQPIRPVAADPVRAVPSPDEVEETPVAFLIFAVLASAVGVAAIVAAQPPADRDGRQHRGVRARPARARSRTHRRGDAEPPSRGRRSGSGPRHRPRYREHARIRASAGHHPERADGHRAQQPHPGRARDGPRGVADDRPHARLHRRGAAAARWRDHRLRHHAAHDPAAVPARRRQPPLPRARADLRAVGDHPRRAARGARSGARARARRRPT